LLRGGRKWPNTIRINLWYHLQPQ